MADFYVPLATNTIDDLDTQIAAGPPKVDTSFISNALDNYNAGGQIKQQMALRNIFQNGYDPATAAQKLLQVGGASQIPNAMALQKFGIASQLLGNNSPVSAPPSSATAIPSPGIKPQNNPGNIENGTFASSIPGYQQTNGRFASFATPEAGAAAEDKLISSYGSRGIVTPLAIASRWAPAGDGNNNPQQYGAFIAAQLGVNPDTPLDLTNPQIRQRVAAAINRFEGNGGAQSDAPQAPQPQGVPQQPQAAPQPQQAAPTMTEAAASRYEQAANVFYQKAQAASLVDRAMSAAFKAQGDAYMNQASIIRKAISKNSELTPEQKNSSDPNAANYASTVETNKQDTDTFQKRYTGLQTAGEQAQNGLQKVQLMKNLTLQPGFYSGPLNEHVQTFNQFKSIFGANPSSALPQEAFNKVANDLLQEQVKSMGQSGVGRVLQSEVNIMKQSIASLGITPQSNRALAEILSRVYQQNQDIAALARNIKAPPGQKNVALDNAIHQYISQHPLFTQQEVQHPQLLGAPDAPPQSANWSPQQKQQWAQSVGLKSGDPVRFNGQIVSVP